INKSYRDYIHQELEFINSAEGKQIGKYWRENLADDLPVLELPTTSPRPSMRTYNGAAIKFTIKPQLTQQLKQLAKIQLVTIEEILLAVFKVLLYRYTGEQYLLVALLQKRANRLLVERVVGNFNNVTVARQAISATIKFTDLLNQVSQQLFELDSYQNYPFSLLIQELKSYRLSHPPICQVAFGYSKLDKLFKAKELDLDYYDLPQQKVDFELSLEVTDLHKYSLGYWKYNTDVLEAETVAKFAEHFHNLLTAVVENPETPVGKLPMLSDREKHKILVEWNDTKTHDDLSECVHQLFEAQVEKTPEATAVVFEDQKLTYSRLNIKANQLAHYLQKLGVKPENKVGICVERSLEMGVGLLGILKAGGAYIPLDPGYPPERINYMLADSQVSVLLTQEKLVDKLPELKTQQIICLDTDWEEISQENVAPVESVVKPDNLAYIIYTSGSTGKPKGVQIYHASLTNFLKSMSQTPGISKSDILLAVTTICFDIAALELYLPLIVGAKVVIVSREVASDAWQLLSTLDRSGATVMQATPATWRMLLSAGWEASSSDSSSKTPEKELKILCGGEALPTQLANQLLDRGTEVWNMYGPTETTIWSSVYNVMRSPTSEQPVNDIKEKPKSIGKPIANTQTYILDSYLQPVGVGVAGELYIGGVGVAKGYLNRSDLTAERFIPNPFDRQIKNPHSKLYKTGDLARYLPDGNIEYLGRADHQVKIRGFRIETGEIEAALNQHPLVKETVVIAREDRPGEKRLVAYVVLGIDKDNESQMPGETIAQLKQHLKQKLADYMIPSAFVVLPQLPLTPNGKVNRRSLPAPDLSNFSRTENFVAPRDSIEQKLAEIWSQLLNINPVGVKDNFFELGGHSLLAVNLMAKIQRHFGKQLPLSALFTSRTIEDLANLVRQENPSSYSSLVPINTQGNKPPFFCVHPAGGNVLCYLDLSHYLGKNKPFYGLQAQGFNEGEKIFTTVEDMARFYVKIIQEFQPEGSLQIGGWSFGGVVAFEMAQQLLQQGRNVSLLAIFDTWVPILIDPNKQINNMYLTGALNRYFGGIFGTKKLFDDDELIGLSSDNKINVIIDKAEELGLFPPEASREQNQRFVDIIVGTLKATYAYKRQHYPGKVTVFRPRERHLNAPDPQLVWVELCAILDAADIEVVMVPGSHYSCLNGSNVKVLVESLISRLQ
ncbi:MAG: amino acid adenylation domain-containing protein, partial [Moorea sp. SIO2I5]|nr:amino acid adenylation domain-containing protein [Moorena sp. SIO2I5]